MKTRTALATRPIRLGELPALGAAATPGESTGHPRGSRPLRARRRRPRIVRPRPGSTNRTGESSQRRTYKKLDSKTAKNGDNVVVQTLTSVKNPDGTEIPKGSKLVGHLLAVAAEPGGPEFPDGAGV